MADADGVREVVVVDHRGRVDHRLGIGVVCSLSRVDSEARAMTIFYNGKYPNRIESVWRVRKELDPRQPWMLRTNIGAMYTFDPSDARRTIASPSDLIGMDYNSVPSARWVDNSDKRKPGKRHRL